MCDYRVEKISDGFWQIRDSRGDSAYLIEGEERALLIDTAMSEEPIMPLLRSLTKKPVTLALTHAHTDHMYRCDEFDRVYIHINDIEDWHRGLGRVMAMSFPLFRVKRKSFNSGAFAPLYDDSVIDLGGIKIKCLRVSGHTRGSLVFIDDFHRAVLCGDAAGVAMWLFLPYCTDVSTYKRELEKAEKALAPYKDYSFYHGHCGDEPQPLGIESFTDTRIICDRLLAGVAELKKIKILPLPGVRYVSHGTAGMVVRKSKIK